MLWRGLASSHPVSAEARSYMWQEQHQPGYVVHFVLHTGGQPVFRDTACITDVTLSTVLHISTVLST